ncbi:hypothetical protein [Pseudomonas prosekii]|uniref:Glutamate 5-kinase n=1 Tax=Pseudomonas prosekii TaxID=1148509 RepID=A0A1H2B391_9PSED|nr:hypothetical protein [Pseudomonas prosekii]SDT52725.1 hypothetical protein SAMN05216222_4894 [Pseudomonas prosekii]
MSIRDTMQSSFGALFNGAFAEVMTQFTGTYLGPGVYDPVTEEATAQPVTYTGRGVLTRYKLEQIDNVNILSTDSLLIVLTNEVTGVPSAGHKIAAKDPVTGQVKTFDLLPVKADPARVHYQLQLRAV